MVAASGPTTCHPPLGPRCTCAPLASRTASRAGVCGERTTVAVAAWASMNCETVVSAINRPRPITTRRSAVSSISLIR